MSAPIVIKRGGGRRAPPDPWSSFSRKLTGWAIAVAIFSFAIALVMGAFGERMVEPVTAKPSAFSWSAVGQRAMVKALQDEGVRTVVRRDPRHPAGGPGLTVIFDEPNLDDMRQQATDFARLVSSARQAGSRVVIVLPKWDATVDEGHEPPWIESVAPADPSETRDMLETSGVSGIAAIGIDRAEEDDCDAYGELGRFRLHTPQGQRIEAPYGGTLVSLLECPDGALVVGDQRGLFVVADPDLFDNQGIGDADNAKLLAAIVGPGRTAVFDEAIHGFRLRFNLLSEMTRFPLVIATLHALLLLGVVLWAGMGRFGKPQPVAAARAAGSEALVANTAELLGAGGHTNASLQSYWRDAVRAIASHHNLPPEMKESEALAAISRIAGARGIDFPAGKIAAQVRMLGGGVRADERAVRLAVAIHRWRSEMTDAR